MGEPWNLPQGRTRPLTLEELIGLSHAGGRDALCYGCGARKPPHLGAVFICDNCGRTVCNECWHNSQHASGRCSAVNATAEGQAAEWAAEIKAGRVTPEGVIATGVVPDVGGEV